MIWVQFWSVVSILLMIAFAIVMVLWIRKLIIDALNFKTPLRPNGSYSWRDEATLANRAARKRRQRARRKLRDAGASEQEVYEHVPEQGF